jgi:hypothetical protein
MSHPVLRKVKSSTNRLSDQPRRRRPGPFSLFIGIAFGMPGLLNIGIDAREQLVVVH